MVIESTILWVPIYSSVNLQCLDAIPRKRTLFVPIWYKVVGAICRLPLEVTGMSCVEWPTGGTCALRARKTTLLVLHKWQEMEKLTTIHITDEG